MIGRKIESTNCGKIRVWQPPNDVNLGPGVSSGGRMSNEPVDAEIAASVRGAEEPVLVTPAIPPQQRNLCPLTAKKEP